MLTLVWFVVGGLVGWGAAHGGPAVQRAWPVFLRIQILATSATLSLVAAWRLTSVSQLLGPLALSAGMWLLLGATLVSRGERSAGQSSLEAWAVSPNASFWVVPTAAAFAGSAGTMIAVLANVITTAWDAVVVHVMRRDAPFRQRRSTTWVDQSPVLASLVGLGLHVFGPAPAWTADVLTLAGPLLAFSGAALFIGSVIHPHNLAVPRTAHALRRWGWLTVVRIAYYALVATAAALAGSTALTSWPSSRRSAPRRSSPCNSRCSTGIAPRSSWPPCAGAGSWPRSVSARRRSSSINRSWPAGCGVTMASPTVLSSLRHSRPTGACAGFDS